MNSQSRAQSEMEEPRLKILEKMVLYQLNKAKASILNGETGDQKIKTGHVVEVNQTVNIIRCSNRPFDDQNKVNDCRYIGCAGTDKNLEKLILRTMNSVLENFNIGEHEATEMFIQWFGCAIIRFDVYCYRCNFSSNEVVKNFEGAIGVIIMKRTINLIATNPQILASTIFHQVTRYQKPGKTTDIINEVVTVINAISTTASKLEFIKSTSYKQTIHNKCHCCCKWLHEYASANPTTTCASKTKHVKNKKTRKKIRKRGRKRRHRKKK